jgi:hypothetical protein
LFCNDAESVTHLFFDCSVAQAFWVEVSETVGRSVGADFELVAHLWVCGKRFKLINAFTTAAFWTIWKMINELSFQGVRWTGMRRMFGRCARMLRD